MWQAIQYVSSGLTLAAFVVAVVAWVFKAKSEERARLIDLAKEDERADLVRDALEFFRVDTVGLTKSQQYSLALEQIRGRAQRFKIVAIVVCTLALLGTAVAAFALARQSGSGVRPVSEDAKNGAALLRDARFQFEANVHAGAWKTVEQACALLPRSKEARDLQVDIAMAWVREWGTSLRDDLAVQAGALASCLAEAAPTATGSRAGDILAHLGWVDLLRSSGELPVETQFRAAVAADAANPYAHGMWGYYLISRARKPAEGKTHFDSAFRSGRGRELEFVRHLQLEAWIHGRELQDRFELIRVVDDMRKRKETWPVDYRDRLLSYAYHPCNAEFLQGARSILPPAEHLATFLWLIEGAGDRSATQDFILAQLQDAAGHPQEALALYRALLGQPTVFQTQIKEEIRRIKDALGEQTSETAVLIAQAKAADAATRARLIGSLGRADADPGEAIPALLTWARDADAEVRAAAVGALTRFGRAAVPGITAMLASSQRRDVLTAAALLEDIGLEPKTAVPALVKALDHSDPEVRARVASALGRFGGEAEPAVAPLLELLRRAASAEAQSGLVYALGEIGPAAKDAVPQLTELVESGRDPRGFLRGMAAEALGKIGPGAASSVPVLIAGLDPRDLRLRTEAAGALGLMGVGARAAVPALAEALAGETEHPRNFGEPLERIAESLANQGDVQSLPTLRKAMRTLEAANVSPKYITPIREAVDVLRGEVSRSKEE